jgi:site-specific DNA recombinase
MKYFLYCRKSTEDEERQVLSLQSQREAVDRNFAGRADIEIAGVFEESKSAKTPGRPIFAAMLERIEAGEADGIMSWAPDRLARNSIDGGRIIYLLDTGVLRDLKFATYTFENNSQGKFMLSIMFGQSKYYSDALSENVKRGNRTKLENGWRPNRAPLGYINDPVTRTILPHPQQFALVRRLFEMILYGGQSPRQIVGIARDEWGFLTPKSRRSGGKPIANSTIYKMLANPFYKGEIERNDQIYPGRHSAIVSPEEFDRVQAILTSRSTPRSSKLSFAFTGLIRCGRCSKMVTAERKRNHYGSRYVYYHCTARSLSRGHCREPSIEERALTDQALNFLSRIAVPEQVAEWVRQELKRESSERERANAIAEQSRKAALSEIDAQIAELTSLRVRRLLCDEEYLESRESLVARRSSLESADHAPDLRTLIEPLELLVSASNKAVEWFTAADEEGKRSILKITGSNFLLKAGKLSMQAARPFFLTDESGEFLRLRRVVAPDRIASRQTSAHAATSRLTPKTLKAGRQDKGIPLTRRQVAGQGRRFLRALGAASATSEGQEWLSHLQHLVQRFRAPAVSTEAPQRRARAWPRPAPPRDRRSPDEPCLEALST